MTSSIKLSDCYSCQSYLDDKIVREKRDSKDYMVSIELMDDDGVMVPIIVDGHHSLAAALADGVDPIINIGSWHTGMSLVNYVSSMRDLSNPRNIVTGIDLW